MTSNGPPSVGSTPRVVTEFLDAYMADWKSRWLEVGESIEAGLRKGEERGIGFMALTLPQRVAGAHAQLAGVPESYRALLGEIGDASLELPFGLVIGPASKVRWRGDHLFFASCNDGHRYFAFQREASEVVGFDDAGNILGAVASTFDSVLSMLTVAIVAGANKGANVASSTWQFLKRTDQTAQKASSFWIEVLKP